jgi:hypothetical protein
MRFLLLVGVLWLSLGVGGYAGLTRYREAHKDNYGCLLYGQSMIHVERDSLYTLPTVRNYLGEELAYPYSEPLFSPDRTRFFAMDNRTGQAFIEELATGDRYPVYRETGYWYSVEWEPSGRGLVYARQMADSPAPGANVTRQVLMFSPEGNLIHEVTFGNTEGFDFSLEDWFKFDAPSGMLLLADYLRGQFHLAPWDGGEVRTYDWLRSERSSIPRQVAWSPSYSHLAFFDNAGLIILSITTGQAWASGRLFPPGELGKDYNTYAVSLHWVSEQQVLVFANSTVYKTDAQIQTFAHFTLGQGGWQQQDLPLESAILISGANSLGDSHWDYFLDITPISQTSPDTIELYRLNLATGQSSLLLTQGELILIEEGVFFFQQQREDWGYYHFRLGEEPGEWQALLPYYRNGEKPTRVRHFDKMKGHIHIVLYYASGEDIDLLFNAEGELVFNSDDPKWLKYYINMNGDLLVQTRRGGLQVYDPLTQLFYDLGTFNQDDYFYSHNLLRYEYPRLFLIYTQHRIKEGEFQWRHTLYALLGPEGRPQQLGEQVEGEFYTYAVSPDVKYLAWSEFAGDAVYLWHYDFEAGRRSYLGNYPITPDDPIWTRCRPAPLP